MCSQVLPGSSAQEGPALHLLHTYLPNQAPLFSCGGGGGLLAESDPTLWDPMDTDCACMGLSRQEYWNSLPSPSPGDLPNPGIEPESPAWQADSLPLSDGVC